MLFVPDQASASVKYCAPMATTYSSAESPDMAIYGFKGFLLEKALGALHPGNPGVGSFLGGEKWQFEQALHNAVPSRRSITVPPEVKT